MDKIIYSILLIIIVVATYWFQSGVVIETQEIHIDIKNHLFIPSEITIPENTKVKIIIHNHDNTDEEFESHDLNREKVIKGKSKGIIFIGPLPAGNYPFEGEFFPRTAEGQIIVTKNLN